MKWIVVFISLAFLSAATSAKTVSDFINEHPDLSKKPSIKAAIQQGAIGNAGLDAASNGANTNDKLNEETSKLLTDNGYEYAQAALRELATSYCSDKDLSDIYGLKEKDCQVIIKVDSEID